VSVSTVYGNRAQLWELIPEAAKHLGPEVVRVGYRLRPDSTGEPSLYFRVVLEDAYIHRDTIFDLTSRIKTILRDIIRPEENWGLHAYFKFRSKSEQDRSGDPDWIWV
jgi:hypothetical protein